MGEGHIAGSLNVPIQELASRVATLALDRDRPLVAICLSGHRSPRGPAARAPRVRGRPAALRRHARVEAERARGVTVRRRVRGPVPAALLVLAGVAGCGGAATGAEDARALMAPGQDCTVCHVFPVAGTIFASAGQGADGLAVTIGRAALTTNAAGNFFTRDEVVFPASAEVRRGDAARRMPRPAPSGACNACHGAGAAPRIDAP
jgi:hypothetical protein